MVDDDDDEEEEEEEKDEEAKSLNGVLILLDVLQL